MTALNEPILRGRGSPTPDFMKDFTITGGSDVLEAKLKELGWQGRTPMASVALHIEEGNIVDTQIFLTGTKEVGKVSAEMLWGQPLTDESYAKIETIDLAHASIHGRMVSDWIAGDKLDWALKVKNNDNNRYKVINKLDDQGLEAKGASKISARIHLAPNKGPSLTATLGVAPSSKVTEMIGHGQMNFPMIRIKDQKLDFFPSEAPGQELGLGFIPFFVCRDEGDIVYPEFTAVRDAIAQMLNTACKAQTHRKFANWKKTAAQGAWEIQDPAYIWPTGALGHEEDDDEGRTCEKFSEINVSLQPDYLGVDFLNL